MKLGRVRLIRFTQFVDEELDLDPRVTVIIGRNDTGKTNILQWFFAMHVKAGTIYGRARPLIEGYHSDPTAFELEWHTEEGDNSLYPLGEAFGAEDVRRFILGFQHESPDGRDYRYAADGRPVDAYEATPGPQGRPTLRQVFTRQKLFPEPYYLGEKPDLQMTFEARFYDRPDPDRTIFHPDIVPTEQLLLRVSGLYGETRRLQ